MDPSASCPHHRDRFRFTNCAGSSDRDEVQAEIMDVRAHLAEEGSLRKRLCLPGTDHGGGFYRGRDGPASRARMAFSCVTLCRSCGRPMASLALINASNPSTRQLPNGSFTTMLCFRTAA